MADAQITKKSWVQLETLVAAVIMAGGITATWIRGEIRGQQNKQAISDVRAELKIYAQTTKDRLTGIEDTLDEMLFQTRLKNEMDAIRMGDRWTSAMQQDLQDQWYDLIKRLHPEAEFEHGELPNIKDIQSRNARGITNGDHH